MTATFMNLDDKTRAQAVLLLEEIEETLSVAERQQYESMLVEMSADQSDQGVGQFDSLLFGLHSGEKLSHSVRDANIVALRSDVLMQIVNTRPMNLDIWGL